MQGLGRQHWEVSEDGRLVAVCFSAEDAERVCAALSVEADAPVADTSSPSGSTWWASLFGQRVV